MPKLYNTKMELLSINSMGLFAFVFQHHFPILVLDHSQM